MGEAGVFSDARLNKKTYQTYQVRFADINISRLAKINISTSCQQIYSCSAVTSNPRVLNCTGLKLGAMGSPMRAEEIHTLLADEEHCVLELQNLGENLYQAMPDDLKDCLCVSMCCCSAIQRYCNSFDNPSAPQFGSSI